MNHRIKAILSLPKSIWVNFRYLPFRQAIKLPILVAYDVRFSAHMGGVILPEKVRFGMIHIGFFNIPVCNHDKTSIRIIGTLEFKGRAYFGRSSKVHIRKGATMLLGDNFRVSSASSFNCYKSMIFGDNVLFAWDCLVMDSDGHSVIDEKCKPKINTKSVIIGNHVWIGCRSMILKGAVIPNNCVVGSMSFVTGENFEENTLIVGVPARSVKKISGWHE